MIAEIENELRNSAENERDKNAVCVADINFALNNGWLIELLRKRGDAIKWKDWKALSEVNLKIADSCKTESQDLYTPNRAFVTFENEISINLMKKQEYARIFG